MKRSHLFMGVLAAVALVMAAQGTQARTITVNKTGGGSFGYNSVKEYHDSDVSTLVCSNPGFEECEWSVEPRGRLVGYAEGQIATGNLSGTYTIVENGIKYHVEWTAEDTENCAITETQTPFEGLL